MDAVRWKRVKDLYGAASARHGGDRTAFLAEHCEGDDDVRREVQRLLEQSADTDGLFDLVGGPPLSSPIDRGRDLTGTRLGVFVVRALIGRGGMGDVYRAHDTKLGRDVAIKVLPSAFTADPARLAGFEREARLLASLNHPNIAAIHGVEESEGVRGLVLELVEGENLADAVHRAHASGKSSFRLHEILGYARQIADALEAAHEKGITHRDLKPANVALTADGVVKLLDFGIAKVVTGDRPGVDLSHTTQTTLEATRAGLIAGTAAYMSPEQARGKPVDKRADIWAFGCVLYELLSRHKAFAGETLSETVTAILDRDPDWSRLPADTPRAVRRLIQRCLTKDPRQRLRDIGDARLDLEQVLRGEADGADDALRQRVRSWQTRTRVAVAAAVVFAAAAAGLAGLALLRDDPSDRRISRFTVTLPEDSVIVPTFNPTVALSADGTQLAYTPLPGPVLIRRLDVLNGEPLAASATPGFRQGPLFSPDGKSIAYVDGNAPYSWRRPFQKVTLAGGPALTLAEYDMFHRGDWSDDGWLYWTDRYPGGIVRIRESGGETEAVTKLDLAKGERSHRFASLLPGGDALIYTVGFEGIANYDEARIDVWDMRTGTSKTIIEGGTSATYSPSGHVVYARSGKLMAVPFDAQRREVTGRAFEVQDGVMMSRNTGAAHYSLSKRGDLAYVPGPGEGGRRTLVWVDRSGKAEPLPLPAASYLYPRISPDGGTMAVEIEGPNHDLYFYDFARTVLSKVTTDGLSHDPVWSPDGVRLAFRSWQAGGMTLWSMRSDRSGAPQRLDPGGTRQSPVSFSPDGRFLAFDQKDPDTGDDAWVLPLEGQPIPQAVAHTRFGEGSMKFSPDGRWVAYSSDESGQPEIYVQAFPGPGLKVQISNEGGTDPVWRRSGGELYYRSDDRMMVVSVVTAPRFTASAPRQLWEGTYSEGIAASCGMPGVSSSNYDVSADGQRFLMVRDEDQSASSTTIVVVLNWVEQVKALERAQARAASPTAR
jgi:serine/threonine protein kinase/Tol biopolymer transport system component